MKRKDREAGETPGRPQKMHGVTRVARMEFYGVLVKYWSTVKSWTGMFGRTGQRQLTPLGGAIRAARLKRIQKVTAFSSNLPHFAPAPTVIGQLERRASHFELRFWKSTLKWSMMKTRAKSSPPQSSNRALMLGRFEG